MKDAIVEQHLEDRLVKWTYQDSIPLTQFDEKASLQNQARFDPIHEEAVLRYAEAMERGDKFPAVVGYKNRQGKIIIIDGNHRYQSSKRNNYKDIDVYVVEATPEIIQVLTFEANSRHGIAPSVEERTRHAIFLIDQGASVDAAAASTGLLSSSVQNAWGLERANRRARSLNVTRGWNKLARDQKTRLAAISTDAGFVAATQLAVDARLSVLDTKKMTAAMKTLRSDRSQVQHVQEIKEELRAMNAEPGSGVKVHAKMDARRSLIPHLGYITSCDMDAVVNSCITPAQLSDTATRVQNALDILELTKAALAERLAK
jgi:ParB-like chromosome segregation protein Spo0J